MQPDALAARKRRPAYLLLHSAIHAVLVCVALQAWPCWQAPVAVLLIHGTIDRIKQSLRDRAAVFVGDQLAHILSLLGLSWLLTRCGILTGFAGVGYKTFIVLGGFAAAVRGSGFLIEKVCSRLVEENHLKLDGLPNGGKWIGQLERALIFLLMFIGQAEGIGFLVAAKSILRFEHAKQQPVAEYVLIGTLLSFSLAIALASLTQWAMKL